MLLVLRDYYHQWKTVSHVQLCVDIFGDKKTLICDSEGIGINSYKTKNK